MRRSGVRDVHHLEPCEFAGSRCDACLQVAQFGASWTRDYRLRGDGGMVTTSRGRRQLHRGRRGCREPRALLGRAMIPEAIRRRISRVHRRNGGQRGVIVDPPSPVLVPDGEPSGSLPAPLSSLRRRLFNSSTCCRNSDNCCHNCSTSSFSSFDLFMAYQLERVGGRCREPRAFWERANDT